MSNQLFEFKMNRLLVIAYPVNEKSVERCRNSVKSCVGTI